MCRREVRLNALRRYKTGQLDLTCKSRHFAGARLAGFEYALGYADLRFIDLADGYVWQRPVAEYRSATLIPLAEFAPDEAALQQVSQHPPFGDVPGVSRAELERQWKEQQEWLNNAEATRGWVAITCNTEVKR